MRIKGRVQINVIKEDEYIKDFEKTAHPEIVNLAWNRLEELIYSEDFNFENMPYIIPLTSEETADGKGHIFHFVGSLSVDEEGVEIIMRYVEVTEE